MTTQPLVYWKIVLEILLLWYFIYMVLAFIKGTRTEQLLKGLVIILVIFIVTQYLQLEAINWVMTRLFPISVIALLVIFQPELRRGLTRLGQFGIRQEQIEVIGEISEAAEELSARKVGALIAIEREVGLKSYIESGIPIDSKVGSELILSIFVPQSPLHDGAVIIRHDRILAAACLLPLTQEEKDISKTLGTRHRAAIGLSEETDAVCVVVSEETGAISVSVRGKLTRNLKEGDLSRILKGIFYRSKRTRGSFSAIALRLFPRLTERES